MKSEIFKLGKHIVRLLPDEEGLQDIGRARTPEPAEVSRPSALFAKMTSGYLLVADESFEISYDDPSLRRLFEIAKDTGAGWVYSDFMQQEGRRLKPHPLNDYSAGSIRDDFNFGPSFVLSAAAMQSAVGRYGPVPSDPSAALYDLRLKISIDHSILHVPEFLYTAAVKKSKSTKTSGVKTEAHFAYVAKENALRQKKLEKVATVYLKHIGAYLPPNVRTTEPPAKDDQWKASIVIPVLNRKKTIGDAVKSALAQQTDFAFNILVVDNHSTDGTADILRKLTAKHPHIHHIVPLRRDLGIGGCWNEAIRSPACGRYAVQLDSDDLYSSPHTLQKIVDTLRKGPYAMVVGSYTLVNEKLKPILPGLIDHREWTKQNGHNNLLRVGGIGAPRAFDTTVLRQIGFPNVSYGEDYAVALRLTREYKIGRIFESLYLCRRWSDNTDAALSVEKQNRNDFYKDRLRTIEIKARQHLGKERSQPFQMESNRIYDEFPGAGARHLPALCHDFFESQKKSWSALALACRDLAGTKTRDVDCGNYSVTLQYNPARAVSGGASVDPESIRNRPCFLCTQNRPADQHAVLYRGEYLILCNPAPIFDHHFTVVSPAHTPQDLASSIGSMMRIAYDAAPDYTVFYNGPACGASAPDHLHFQMIPADALAFLEALSGRRPANAVSPVGFMATENFDRSIVILASSNAETLIKQFQLFMKAARSVMAAKGESPVNVFCDYRKGCFRLTIFLRRKHRPDAYYAEGDRRIFVSPGAIDMAGVIVIPRLIDFERLDAETLQGIYREVSLAEETLENIKNNYDGALKSLFFEKGAKGI